MAEHEKWKALAARQHGVVTRSQLTECGMSSKAVRHAVSKGRLERLTPRVLAVVGSADTPLQRVMAASVDATGGAVALHSALALWGVPGWRLEPVHVLTSRRPHRGGPHLGIVHSSVRFGDDDVGEVDGIRVTTPVRTLIDLSARLRVDRVAGLCDDLLRRRLVSIEMLHREVGALPRRGGIGGYSLLRSLVAERPEGYRPTDSRLEWRFEQVLERAGESPFDRQVDLGDDHGWIGRVDYADRRLRVVVEVQSELFHSSLTDRRKDAVRLARLRSAGWIVLEVTDDEIFRRPDGVVSRIRAARSRAAAAA